MTTFVGKQQDFGKAAVSLLELEYDAIEAYLKAIEELESIDYKDKLREFASDHDRHIRQLSMLLRMHRVDFSPGPDLKQWLTKGKVMLGNLMGDKSILSAMHANEIDTNTAYDHMLEREDIWDDAQEILENAREDERKHKAWLEQEIK